MNARYAPGWGEREFGPETAAALLWCLSRLAAGDRWE